LGELHGGRTDFQNMILKFAIVALDKVARLFRRSADGLEAR
jgi:hypothetical protein